MTNQKINPLLIPNVTKIKGNTQSGESQNRLREGETSEFKNLLDGTLGAGNSDLLKNALETRSEKISPDKIIFSSHALKRLEERQLSFDKEEYGKLQNAIQKLKMKGGQDSLVVTSKAAYIIDVDKNTVVTAMDKEKVSENVFTKIDSTILMN